MDELKQSPFGAAALETTLSTVITYMIDEGVIDWPTAIDRLSTTPARIAGIEAGTLAVGAPADIAIIDPSTQWTVDGTKFRSNCICSPLDGHDLRGRVTHTMVDGIVRYQLGK